MTEPTKLLCAEIGVLDHGYVRFIDSMGEDSTIIEAARMSTGKGFLGWGPRHADNCPDPTGFKGLGVCCKTQPGDEKLLAFLYEHRHMTPFEMCELHLEVRAPIMVFREWHRHRTQCLRGSTKIACISPRGTIYTRTIKELFDLKHGGVIDQMISAKNGFSKAGTPVSRRPRYKHPTRTRVLPNCQNRTLRVLDVSTGMFTSGKMKEVWEAGVKEVWEIRTDAGHVIGASRDHRFLTEDGWKRQHELRVGDRIASNGKVAAKERPIPPSLRHGIGVWTTMMRKRLIAPDAACYVCGGWFVFDDLQLDHVIPVRVDLKLALDVENLKPICSRCHRAKTDTEQGDRKGVTRLGVRWVKITGMKCLGREMTYDIEVEGPNHNFVADWIVVHNSFNEMSGRYTALPNLYYTPVPERVQRQSKVNKQGSEVPMDVEDAKGFIAMSTLQQRAYRDEYERVLALGVAREIARLNCPVSQYSTMRVKTDLRNWLGFLALRMPENAQYEIRQYAHAVASIIKDLWPRTYALFEEHTLHAVTLSRTEVAWLSEECVHQMGAPGGPPSSLLKKLGIV